MEILIIIEFSSYYKKDFCFTASRRYEAAGWLRKMVGVVAAKDLPAEPSEEEFRLGLRSGIILCNALNKIQPGAVPKVKLKLSLSCRLFINLFLNDSIFIIVFR